jgi:hypothetical protein
MTADFEAERRVTITLSKLEADQIDVWRGRMNLGDREEAIHALLDLGLEADRSIRSGTLR